VTKHIEFVIITVLVVKEVFR